MVRVLLADDHPVIREGVAAVMELQDDMQVVGEASDGAETIELYRQLAPDVLVLDLQMPVMGGAEVTKAICSEFPGARIIVLTVHDGDEDIFRCLHAGAAAYLLKHVSKTEIIDAVRSVYAGNELISPEIAEKLAQRIHRSELTLRELGVLHELAEGKSNQEIGVALSISEGTVKSHVVSILAKLGVSDRTQAVIYAIQTGIVHVKNS